MIYKTICDITVNVRYIKLELLSHNLIPLLTRQVIAEAHRQQFLYFSHKSYEAKCCKKALSAQLFPPSPTGLTVLSVQNLSNIT